MLQRARKDIIILHELEKFGEKYLVLTTHPSTNLSLSLNIDYVSKSWYIIKKQNNTNITSVQPYKDQPTRKSKANTIQNNIHF